MARNIWTLATMTHVLALQTRHTKSCHMNRKQCQMNGKHAGVAQNQGLKGLQFFCFARRLTCSPDSHFRPKRFVVTVALAWVITSKRFCRRSIGETVPSAY